MDDNENTTLPRTKEALEHLEVAVGANEDKYVADDSSDSSQSEEEDSGIMNEVVQVDKDENVNHRSSSDPSEENDSGVLDEAAGAQKAIHEGITCDEFQDLPKELADNFSSQALGTSTSAETNQERGNQLFRELENLYSDALVYYPDEFECPICLEHYEELNGIILKECLHVFCRDCLLNTIELSESIDVNCPFRDDSYSCSSIILEDEIKSLLSPESYENRLTKTLAFAEATMQNTFHCKTPDCKGWCVIGDAITVFLCPVCSIANCIKCKVIHEGITCAEYNDILMNKSEINLSSKLSEAALRDMVQCGVAMRCPNCQAVITKQTGCDAILCSMCKTPICWATKGPRWGPRGVGDTSGGCRCNVNGIKCHPQCSNCH